MKSVDWLALVLYAFFGFVLNISGVGVLTQPLNFFVLLIILMVVDMRSHQEGLNRGVEIVKQVWGIK